MDGASYLKYTCDITREHDGMIDHGAERKNVIPSRK